MYSSVYIPAQCLCAGMSALLCMSDVILHQPIKTAENWHPEDARVTMPAPVRDIARVEIEESIFDFSSALKEVEK